MKLVKASQDIAIPDDVKLEVKARKIRVTGPRGKHSVRFSLEYRNLGYCS